MKKILTSLILSTFALLISVPTIAADDYGAMEGHYSVETTMVAKLLDDPAADEILKKMIPSVYANDMFHSMGRDQTLKAIQQYEPQALSDENLKKLQAELNKIPAKE